MLCADLSHQIYFFQNPKKKRESLSLLFALSAAVVSSERSAWTTHFENKYLTEYGQEPLLLNEGLGKGFEIGIQVG